MKTCEKYRQILKKAHCRAISDKALQNNITHWKIFSPKQKDELDNDMFGTLQELF